MGRGGRAGRRPAIRIIYDTAFTSDPADVEVQRAQRFAAMTDLVGVVGPWTFMLAPDDSAEGAFMAAFAAERLGAQRVSIFFVNDEYGAGLRDGVRAELQQRRVTVLDEVGFGRERAPYPGVTGPISFRPDRTPRLVMARLVRGAAVRMESR